MSTALSVPGPCAALHAAVLPPTAYDLLRTMPATYVFSLYPVDQIAAQRALIDQVVMALETWFTSAAEMVNHMANLWQQSYIPSLSALRYLGQLGDNSQRISIIQTVERFFEIVTASDETVAFDDWLDYTDEVADEYEMLRLVAQIVAKVWTADGPLPYSPYEQYQADSCVTFFLQLTGQPPQDDDYS